MALTRVHSQLLDAGSVIQVVRQEWTTETFLSSPNNTYYDVNASSFTFTPKRANSKILLMCDVSLEWQTSGGNAGGAAYRVMRDGVAQNPPALVHEHYSSLTGADMYMRSAKSIWMNANATTSTTFKLQLSGYQSTTTSVYINRAANFMSAINVFEIAQ